MDGRINLIAMIQLAYRYSCNWRYQFNYDKTRVLVFGKCAVTHSKNKYVSGNLVFENSECVNLGVFKNRFGHFHKILMRISLRPEKKQECYSLPILTGEE